MRNPFRYINSSPEAPEAYILDSSPRLRPWVMSMNGLSGGMRRLIVPYQRRDARIHHALHGDLVCLEIGE